MHSLSHSLSISLPLLLFSCTTKLRLFKNVVYIVIAVIVVIIAVYFALRQTDRHIHTHMYMHAIDSLSLSLSPYLSLSILSTLSVIRIMEQQKKLRCLFFVLLLNFIIEILSPPSHQPTTMTLLFPQFHLAPPTELTATLTLAARVLRCCAVGFIVSPLLLSPRLPPCAPLCSNHSHSNHLSPHPSHPFLHSLSPPTGLTCFCCYFAVAFVSLLSLLFDLAASSSRLLRNKKTKKSNKKTVFKTHLTNLRFYCRHIHSTK